MHSRAALFVSLFALAAVPRAAHAQLAALTIATDADREDVTVLDAHDAVVARCWAPCEPRVQPGAYRVRLSTYSSTAERYVVVGPRGLRVDDRHASLAPAALGYVGGALAMNAALALALTTMAHIAEERAAAMNTQTPPARVDHTAEFAGAAVLGAVGLVALGIAAVDNVRRVHAVRSAAEARDAVRVNVAPSGGCLFASLTVQF